MNQEQEKQEKQNVESGENKDSVDIFIEAYQKYNGDEYMPRAEHESIVGKFRERESKMLNAMLKGETINQEKKEAKKESIADLRKKLYGADCDTLSQLSYWENTLKLRKAIIDEGGRDPFLPVGKHGVETTDEMIEKMENVAQGMQALVDQANGSSTMFTALYQDNVLDTNIPIKGIKKQNRKF